MSKLPMEAFIGSVDSDITEEEEHGNSYMFSYGATLKVKRVLRGIKCLKRYHSEWTLIYVITFINVVQAVKVHEKLKVKTRELEIQTT